MCEAVVTLSKDLSKQSDHAKEDELCWICHEGHSESLPLEAPCRCRSMKAHRPCLARWQLQQAGRSEERFCRFCNAELPDWRDVHVGFPKATPVMTVVHNGVTHQVRVDSGPGGRERFQSMIRKIFNLGEEDAIQLTFGCRVPGAGNEITLEGWEAFDAAVHCAAISAGQRLASQHGQPLQHPHETGAKPSGKVARQMSGGGVLRRLFSRGSH